MPGLRILYLHQHFSTPAGATGTRSHAMARALAARGHAVTLACGQYAGAVTGLEGGFRRGRREGRVAGFRVVEFAIPCGNAQGLAARAAAFLRYAARATALALSGPWDVLVASSTPLTVALPALAARQMRGLPFVFEIRDPWPGLPRAMGIGSPPLWAAMDRLADAACRRAAAVVALSEGMAETARAHGAAPGAVHVVPNGSDLDLFGPQVAPWRPEMAGSEEVVAVYAGAHGRANGLDQLLDAAALLRGAPLRLVLVGQGAGKPRLLARAAAEGLGNVSFLDPLPKPRLAALLAGSQIGLQCLAPVADFAEWTAPNKLMDYLAAGLPVVSNLPGRAARLLAQGPCGIATPPGDAAALAEALAVLARDPARRAALGTAARRQAVRRWDRRLLAAEFCAVVEAAARPMPARSLVPA
ncbi:glycosyltransferase family 4 protein [Siccirubricoccus sp. G192]|uniref:glycosyltransferase family 4 protein n=1 Tax=Siccirubricoccus sp. G192 TaxID=2849651 RepID=UPI001C2B90ED|nr:glycosyltransferase family 4 protein [Siccirubricoccus sp. G192]MBV1796738.1 glycosyltransferase family 4 protein [Siccirubricoccus sp. G192]